MKKFLLIILFAVILPQDNQPYPPLDLVSMPTAGTLPKGVFSLETLLMKDGGVLPKMLFGISDRFTFGVSFGIQQFIGVGDISKNKSAPEVQMKYRLYDETDIRPAIVLGLNTQGKGVYKVHDSDIIVEIKAQDYVPLEYLFKKFQFDRIRFSKYSKAINSFL